MYPKIEKSSVSEHIANELLALIRERKLRPGDKLPPERELAVMMDVSRPSLREALRALSIMKVVEMRQGAGTYVASLEPKQLVEHLDFVFALDDSTYLELLEARKVVEVGLIGLAAERITDQDLTRLQRCLSESIKNVDNPQAFIAADVDLHNIISEAADNPLLSRLMESVSRLSRASRERTTGIRGVPEQVVEDHRRIIEALESRDRAEAQAAMLAHLSRIEEVLEKERLATSP